MASRVALALCVHHKPWLSMSTLVTAGLQDDQSFDIHFLHNLGDGVVRKPSYARYDALVVDGQDNTHLSPYDPRVRDVCSLRRERTHTVEYENDHTLDSGAYLKFIRDGRWRNYDYVLFAGEGTLFARPRVLSAMQHLAADRNVDFIASGHEQRRLPRDLMLHYYERHGRPSAMQSFHDEMIREAFAIFCRDADFRTLFEAWRSDEPGQTEHHVPDIPPESALAERVRSAIARRFGTPDAGQGEGISRWLRELPYRLDERATVAAIRAGQPATWPTLREPGWNSSEEQVWVDQVCFNRVGGPEWFGCTPILFVSRRFLERLTAKLEAHRMFEVLDLPFAATALEVVWGFLPAWLGVEKWFTDGFHRVRKHFVTYRREDQPPDMASYINRYHRGRVSVAWDGDFVRVRDLAPAHAWLRDVLPGSYFA